MGHKGFVVVLLLLASLVFSFRSEAATSKFKVTVSIAPQKELIEALGGDRVSVSVMVPYGADPHTYEPKPSQLVNLSRSSMYAKVGTPIEFELVWMKRMTQLNPTMLVVDMSKGVTLLNVGEAEFGHSHGDHLTEKPLMDPHIWLSPKNLKIGAQDVLEGLIQIDPAGKDYYRANKVDYCNKLDDIDKGIKELLGRLKSRKFIVFHPSFGYFARDYGLVQVPIQIMGKDPTARDLKAVIDIAKKESIRVIFASPRFSTASAEAIASQIGGSVLLLDPLAENMLENLKNIAHAFSRSL